MTNRGSSRNLPFVVVRGALQYLLTVRSFERNVRLFLTVTAFRGMVIASLQTVLNLYLYSRGYNAGSIGLINAGNALAVLLFSVPLGYAADRLGRRPILLLGCVGYPLCLVGLALASSTGLILLFNFLFGVFSSAYWVAGVPLLFASTPERDRVHAFSLNSFLLWGFGPLGALMSGVVVQLAGQVLHVSASSTAALRIGMVFIVLLALIGSIPYPFLREPVRTRSTGGEAPPRRALASLFIRLLAPDLVIAFGLGMILTFGQLYFHLRFGLPAGAVGVVIAIGGVTAGSATLVTPLLARRWGNLRTTVRSQWTAVPLLAVLALSHALPLALLAYWGALMLRGMADPVYTGFVQERVPEVYRARLTGLYSVTYSIGYSVGPAVSGALQQLGGFTPAFLLGAGCYGLGASMLFLFFRRTSRQAAVAR